MTFRVAHRITETIKERAVAKVRTKKVEAPPPKESKRGGFREGSGRKPIGGRSMDVGIYLRCSPEQKEALTAYVHGLSEERKSQGLPGVDLSTWIRELALKASGNERLGLAAQQRARAEASATIV